MSKIQFIQTSPADLADLIQQGLKEEVEQIFKEISEKKQIEKEFLTRKETADFFDVSVVTIHAWINDGLIFPFKMGNRTYFKRSDLIDRLLNSNKQAS